MWVAAAKLQTLRSKFKQISGSHGEYEDDSFPGYGAISQKAAIFKFKQRSLLKL
jgi:hypothetical protein